MLGGFIIAAALTIILLVVSVIALIKKQSCGIIGIFVSIATSVILITGGLDWGSPQIVYVYDKEVVEINKAEKAYNYIVYYIYNDNCYSTEVNGETYFEIDCKKGVDNYELDAVYFQNSQLIEKTKSVKE